MKPTSLRGPTGGTLPWIRPNETFRALPVAAGWELILGGFLLLVVGGAALYLGLALRLAREAGYPLDDAWIHQTYARNLVQYREWSFVPGEPSAGSTAPLWTILLSVGHLLPGDPRFWTYALGLGALLGTALATRGLSAALFGSRQLAFWTGIAVLVEWHMVWAAVSGMEVLLYTGLSVALLALALTPGGSSRPLLLGSLAGLLVLTRPDGLWLAGLVGLTIVLRPDLVVFKSRLRGALLYGVTVSAVVLPYLALNWHITGHLLPNTFFAKQVEYHALVEMIPFWRRLLTLAALPMVGAQALLLVPLVAVAVHRVVRAARRSGEDGGEQQRAASHLAAPLLPLLWASGLLIVYALRLPVTYQHGRYLMPIIPIILLYGLWALREFTASAPWVAQRTLVISTVILFVFFWVRGGVAYAEDTAIINCEMVETARWIAANTSPTEIVAAHDIGALGYFGRRPLLDLAGLVSPEVLPILRNEGGLISLMRTRDVSYAIFFPDWYPQIASHPMLRLVRQSECRLTQQAGRENMAIYKMRPGD